MDVGAMGTGIMSRDYFLDPRRPSLLNTYITDVNRPFQVQVDLVTGDRLLHFAALRK
jgi:hypothetical protein